MCDLVLDHTLCKRTLIENGLWVEGTDENELKSSFSGDEHLSQPQDDQSNEYMRHFAIINQSTVDDGLDVDKVEEPPEEEVLEPMMESNSPERSSPEQ
mmetsp:Transcript_13209/g.20594  ORF Transcript_13209/g.20594 Transcript_13209/m.20594 type:complete len:98 (-) Transcript_13209:2328-2621(-)